MKTRKPSHLWLAGNGSFGCLYDNAGAYRSYKAACSSIIDLFDLAHTRKAGELRRNGYVDLGEDFGADYAEVIEIRGSDLDGWFNEDGEARQ